MGARRRPAGRIAGPRHRDRGYAARPALETSLTLSRVASRADAIPTSPPADGNARPIKGMQYHACNEYDYLLHQRRARGGCAPRPGDHAARRLWRRLYRRPWPGAADARPALQRLGVAG